jgi:hypothetical protein
MPIAALDLDWGPAVIIPRPSSRSAAPKLFLLASIVRESADAEAKIWRMTCPVSIASTSYGVKTRSAFPMCEISA